jgi:3-hydroxymyristoyl/3-hydroxydecanoyl-(acyl carrier protein) dehydratase
MLPMLVFEAVGQAAAWLIAEATEHKRRLLVVMVPHLRLLAPAPQGSLLQLNAEIDQLRGDSVRFTGNVKIDGKPILTAEKVMGFLARLETLTDPEASMHDLEALMVAEATHTRDDVFVPPELLIDEIVAEQPGERIEAQTLVPTDAPQFADHFPRRPLMPGSLLGEIVAQLSARVVADGGDQQFSLTEVKRARFREPVVPGDTLWVVVTRNSDLGAYGEVFVDGDLKASGQFEFTPVEVDSVERARRARIWSSIS